MSDNWELAVSHASGEYVTVVGDDDGLMPYALHELDRILTQHPVTLLHWQRAVYTWPTLPVAEDANYLFIPCSRALRSVDGRARIRAVVHFECCWDQLPMIYNSVVHHSLLARLCKKTGRVFYNRIPDAYSGFALAAIAGTFLTSSVPMNMAGLSAGSNGVAHAQLQNQSSVAFDFQQLNEASGYHPHRLVPDVPANSVPIMDAFCDAKDQLFPLDNELVLDRRAMALRYVAELFETDPEQRRHYLRMIRDTLSDHPEWQTWFDAQAPLLPPGKRPRLSGSARGVFGDVVCLSADRFGIRDIAGAVDFAARLLSFNEREINYDLLLRDLAPPVPRRLSLKDVLHNLTPPLLWRLGRSCARFAIGKAKADRQLRPYAQ